MWQANGALAAARAPFGFPVSFIVAAANVHDRVEE
jgi:hypothetical protein